MIPFIGLRRGGQIELSEKFNVSRPTVCETLRFRRHSLENRRMRSYAMNVLGGYYVELS